MKLTGHHDGCDCLDCLKEIDENNRRSIWPPFISGIPFVPDYPSVFVPEYLKLWEAR